LRFPSGTGLSGTGLSSLLRRAIHDLWLLASTTDLNAPREENDPERQLYDGADSEAGSCSLVQAIVFIAVIDGVNGDFVVVDTVVNAAVLGTEEAPSDGEEEDPCYEEADGP
jgi:hypothetical protein